MIFRSLSGTGDWRFGRGAADYAHDNQAIALNIQTRIKSWVGGCFFDQAMGIDWCNLLDKGQKELLLNNLRTLILTSYGVVKINSVVTIFDSRTRALTVSYNIDTIFSSSFQRQIAAAAGTVAQ